MKKPSLLLLVLYLILPFTATAQSTSTVDIRTTKTYQTMDGFGAAIAWYENWLTEHPNKSDIYKLIFGDLNLDILRLRNIYGYDSNTLDVSKEIVQKARTSLGHPVTILLSSWSPPANLKKNNVTHGGTLLKTNGQFVYNDFARWWYDSIRAYTAAGIVPTYISMQNEPDYENSGWETCIFENIESTDYPGYGAALEALSNRLQTLANRPLIIGPESAGIGYNTFQGYVGNLNRSLLDAYAYHLYNGGDSDNPDSFNANLSAIKNNYGDKPNIMTEYSSEGWFSTAWLIQNCLVNANASAYLYWDLIWGDSAGLVTLQNPWNPSSWTTADGYKVNANYYAFKHFSKNITPGYVRIGATSSNTNLRTSAFLSPDGSKLAIVVLNVASNDESATFAFTGFNAASAVGYQSVDSHFYQPLRSLTPTSSITLPAKSVTTIEYSKSTGGTPVTGVAVTPTQAMINGLSTTQLTAVVSPSNADNKAVVWSSSDENIATVSTTGLVSAVTEGTATITVATQDGGYTATCTVTVTGTENGNESEPCNSPVSTALPLVINGKGESCYVTSGNITHINSWNMQLVEINGVAYTNTWSNKMPARINGNYYIHYVGKYRWSHLRVKGSGGNSGTTTYVLSTKVNGQGRVSPSAGTYEQGTAVTLTATPASGWQFDNWSGAASGTNATISVTMNSNLSVTANFSEIQTDGLEVTLQENETGFCAVDGAVESEHNGYTGSGYANTENALGNGVDYKVHVGSAGTYHIEIRYASANDRPANLIQNGSVVASNINFPSTGAWTSWKTASITARLNAGESDLRLEATGRSGLPNIDFLYLSGSNISAADCGSSQEERRYSLSTNVSPSGSGYIRLNPSGGTYNEGTVVTITAIANTDYEFSSWSGDASGSSTSTTVPMNSNLSVIANFSYSGDGTTDECTPPAPGSKGTNPLFTDEFTADPAVLIDHCTFYIQCGHDEAAAGQNAFVMKEWFVLSSTDMVHWTKQVAMGLSTFRWANANAWAGQMVRAANGKYYWYVPVQEASSGTMAIGVAVADRPTGPWTDALGKPLINDAFEISNMGFATPSDTPFTIDPTVWVDDDGQAYLHYGGFGRMVVARLNSDMISVNGRMQESSPRGYFEAPYLIKRNNVYYEIYAAGPNPSSIDYATSDSPMGPWTYRGRILDPFPRAPGQTDWPTNQAGVGRFAGQWYIAYHVSDGPNGGGTYRREVAVDKLFFNSDGSIQKVTPSPGLAFDSDTGNDATISPRSASFDQNTSHQADITVTMTLNGNTLSAVKNGSTTLVSGADYTVSGSTVTIRKSYLAKQAVGTVNLTFEFSAGADQVLSVTVTDTTAVNYILNISVNGNGTTSPAAGAHSYPAGTSVRVTATPAAGATFSGWSGAASGTTNPITVTMDADKSLTASFSDSSDEGACISGSTNTVWADSCPTSSPTSCVAGTWKDPGSTTGDPLQCESAHFAVHAPPGTITAAQCQAAIDELENVIWPTYFGSPIFFPEPYCNSATKWKASIVIHSDYSLTGGGWGNGYMGMWIGPGATSDHWGLAHEFTHAVQSTTGGLAGCNPNTCGWIWESHANFMPHQLEEYQSNVHCSEMLVNAPHLYLGSTRDRYCNWQWMEYLKDKYCYKAVNDIWTGSASQHQGDPFLALRTNMGWTQAQLNDFFGEWAMHNITWDYKNPPPTRGDHAGAMFRSNYGLITDKSRPERRLRITRLDPMDLANRRFATPAEWAPQRWGYNVVRLYPDAGATSVTVTFRGVTGGNNGWRWGLVATDSGLTQARYSPVQPGTDGKLTFCIGSGESLWLVVVGAPTVHETIVWDQMYNTVHRYPWMVQLQNAWPEGWQGGTQAACPSGLTRHANGGGCAPASLPSSVYVGPYAQVLGGNVSGNARIDGHATVLSGTVTGGTVEGLSILSDSFSVSGGTVASTFYPLGFFESGQSVSGSAKLIGDIEYRGQGLNKSSGTYYGFVDSSTRPASNTTDVSPAPPYRWRP